jgi:ABC-type nitrate/sulfonate/bicarbonate transport system substrate-binding protein
MNKDRMTECYSRRQQALLKVMLALTVLILTTEGLAAKTTIRVGHFPNVTHAQGLVAHASSRQGKGWFEKRLGPDVTIQWFVYNGGPSAMEAILAKSIDLTPSPGRIRGEFVVNLQRPRDINTAEVAAIAGRITNALKGM